MPTGRGASAAVALSALRPVGKLAILTKFWRKFRGELNGSLSLYKFELKLMASMLMLPLGEHFVKVFIDENSEGAWVENRAAAMPP